MKTKIIEIKTLPNGAHNNQTGELPFVPDGYAVIPEGMETPNFPFGDIEVEEIEGVMIVTKWTAGTLPEIKETEKPITAVEQLRADIDFIAVMKGVEL